MRVVLALRLLVSGLAFPDFQLQGHSRCEPVVSGWGVTRAFTPPQCRWHAGVVARTSWACACSVLRLYSNSMLRPRHFAWSDGCAGQLRVCVRARQLCVTVYVSGVCACRAGQVADDVLGLPHMQHSERLSALA